MSTRQLVVPFCVAVAVLAVLAGAPAWAEYLATAVTEKDGSLPLPEDLSDIAQKRPTDVEQLKPGDKVVSTRKPEPYQFGTPWKL